MKKLFYLFIIGAMFAACNNNESFIPDISVDQLSMDFANYQETKTFIIKSNTSWTIEKSENWITLSNSEGMYNDTIKVTVNNNEATTERIGKITIKVLEHRDIDINVTQSKGYKTEGLFILSEGYYNSDNADIAYYDIETGVITKKYYTQQNDTILGDTGNDMAIYGSKLYCVVSGTSTKDGYINIIDPKNGKSQKRIKIIDQTGKVSMPRCITFYENKAYITTYANNVVRLDTATLKIDATAALSGTFPEGICTSNGKLYICNSGQGTGTTISVVDITSFRETKTITVPRNPSMIVASLGSLYFSTASLSWVDGTPSNLHALDINTEQVTHTFNCLASKIAISKDYIYAVDFDWADYSDHISKINIDTKEIIDLTEKIDGFAMPYSISVNPINQDVYIGNNGQDIIVIDKNDNEILSLKTGVANTSKVVPYIK